MNRDRLRQYAIIAGFILFVVGIAFALYWVFFRPTGDTTGEPQTNNANGGLPNVNDILGNINVPPVNNGNLNGNQNGNVNGSAGGGGAVIADGGPTSVQVLTPNTQTANLAATTTTPSQSPTGVRYYNEQDGKFYSVGADGSITQIGNAQFPSADKVTWSPANNQTIIEFPDGTNVFYDLDTNKQVTLPKEFEEFSFAPDGQQISFLYMHEDPDRRVLAVSAPDGSEARTLEPLGTHANRVQVQWSPTGKVAATWNEFQNVNTQEIGFLGLNDENFKGIVIQGRGLNYIYSSNGAQMLYSTYTAENNYEPRLHIVDADGESIGNNQRDLNLNTFADKCTFNRGSTIAYCGVPSENAFGSGLDRRVSDAIPDYIYRIDLQSGLQTRVAIPVDATGKPVYTVGENSMVLTDGGLIFQDVNTGEIVRVQL